MDLVTEIVGNKNNPATLKLAIAANYAKSKTTLTLDRAGSESSRRIPCAKLTSGQDLFIPNAIVMYLKQSKENEIEKITELLELEATILSPGLAICVGSNSKQAKAKSNVIEVLKKLHTGLGSRSFLVGDEITAADISLWSTLYPLSKSSKLAKEYFSEFTSILSWIERLEKISEFKEAVALVFPKPNEIGEQSYQILLQTSKYILSQPSSDHQVLQNSPSMDADTQKNELDTVTAEEIKAAQEAWKKNVDQLRKINKPDKVVLPKPNEKNIFITSALPYVNNVPHLGNIIGCVLSADVFARFCRLCNYNTLYICGTDEYGTATETKALEEGLSCKAICDKYFKIHSEIYKWFNISFDHFGRTSNPEQIEQAQDIFLTLNSNGFMFTQSVEQLHCEQCDRFLADRFVEGGCPNIGCTYEDARGDQCDFCGKLVNAIELKNPRCKVCGNTPKIKTSNQFFIDLPKLEPLLRHWLKLSSPGWTRNADGITQSWLKEGLKPRCITRDLKWGVPVPLDGYREKVFYVWFDAPIGYISITKSYTKDFEKWWKPAKDTNITLYNFMAKDNVPFHSVLFPSMLLGANKGYLTVSHIMATEYLNYEDGKFSKSRGKGLFGNDVRDTGIPSDIWRFYLLSIRPESQDSSFSWIDLATRNNSELLNNLGNFVNRALVFAKNNFNKSIPEMSPTEDDYRFLALCTRELKGYVACLEKAKLRDGVKHIMSISRHGNQYMQVNEPWVLVKGTTEEKLRAGTVVGMCCNIARLLATLLAPYMPDTSANLNKQLNATDFVIDTNNIEIINLLPPGHQLGDPAPLFAKIELATIEAFKKKYGGSQESRKEAKNVDVKSLEEQVTKQADKVRQLKSSGKPKDVWQPEVAVLLKLKTELESAKKNSSPVENQVQNGVVDASAVKKLEEEVTKQGEKVRELKSSGKGKDVWQPEVKILLDLKVKLEAAKKSLTIENSEKRTEPTKADPNEVKKLEDEVNKQGEKVRELKSSGKGKDVWQPEVKILLDLKVKLEAAKKSLRIENSEKPAEPTKADPNEVKKLEDEVNKQGLLVRKLKEGGAEKSVWQPEVSKLLALKSQLAAASGTPVEPQKGKKGKK